ncbi:ion channel CASTOR-like protein isoform X2 [Tanacetum coccineum]
MGSRNEAALALFISELGQVEFSDSPDSLPTRLNLTLRGLEIPSIECPICNIGMESVEHVFFGYEFENDGFIINDLNDDEEGKPDIDDEKQKKRRKKRSKRNMVLDDDDYEVIEENNPGFHCHTSENCKRLKKVRTDVGALPLATIDNLFGADDGTFQISMLIIGCGFRMVVVVTVRLNIKLVQREGNAVLRRHLESLPLESFYLANESVEDSALQADFISLATLLLIRKDKSLPYREAKVSHCRKGNASIKDGFCEIMESEGKVLMPSRLKNCSQCFNIASVRRHVCDDRL